MKKIFITGNMGYIGPVLVKHLKENYEDLKIIGCDTGFFANSLTGENFFPENFIDIQLFKDVRHLSVEDLNGCDSVIHLAAISNDPMGKEFQNVTKEINQNSSIKLANLSAQAGVKNFVFASSCSMYGKADDDVPKTEIDITNPLTAYAKSKIGTEDELEIIDSKDMIITSLRFATACGMSDRLRLDLVLNDFVACAITSGEITVLSDGSPWRPLIDVKDMSRAIDWGMFRTGENGGKFLKVNAGADMNNYQVKDLAAMVKEIIPNTKISINKNALPDKRSYKVGFGLFKKLAPNFQPIVNLSQSVEELYNGIKKMGLKENNFRESKYMRLIMLKKLLNNNLINNELYWNK